MKTFFIPILSILLLLSIFTNAQHVINFNIPDCPHPTKIETSQIINASIYPSPAKNSISISIDEHDYSNITKLELLNANGILVSPIKYDNNNYRDGIITLSTEALSEGLYLIRISNTFGHKILRFVKLNN